MELCLGTVQFGMDYGIYNRAMPPVEDSIRCLDYAVQNGISALDTATAYGMAEEIVGRFLAMKTVERDKLWISTKFKPNLLDEYSPDKYQDVILENLKQSLGRLNTDYVDAYYLHSARYAFENEILDALKEVKKSGLARKVGVSVYETDEAIACFEHQMDIIQAPYSIFDHRMKEAGVFDRPDRCHIDTRSAFIQGLIVLNEDSVPPFLERSKPILKKIDQICKETGMGRVELALAYVKREQAITHLVFGVDSLEQLKEDMQLFQREVPAELLMDIEKEFDGIDADIVMPSLWVKK